MAARQNRHSADAVSPEETGVIRKDWGGRIRVALVYPSTYSVGMSNLGFQTVYRLLNDNDDIVCERAFLPDRGRHGVRSIESGRPLGDFDIIAFSISFESDYPHILSLMETAGLPFRSADRTERHPLVVAGGVACFLNPEPVAAFIDVFLMGEAENVLGRFFDVYDPEAGRHRLLLTLARTVPGVYVPAFYAAAYNRDETLRRFAPVEDVPPKVERVFLPDLNEISTCSALLTPETTFDRTCLVEVSRGCPHGCRFCSAGYVYRPPRFRSPEMLRRCVTEGVTRTDRIGLVGAAVSDLPGLAGLCAGVDTDTVRLSFSSLRADALTPELIDILRRSRVKTATIAPDAGSERMRQVINKGIDTETILNATEALVTGGIPNLKLYFMIGLPTETAADVAAILELCGRIKERFLAASRSRGRIGDITVSLNSFVPKPVTPFQWSAMDSVAGLKKKVKTIKSDLKRVANVRLNHDVPRHAHVQALLSRGDRRVARLLLLAHENGGNWAKTLKAAPVNPDFYVCRERAADELFPWDFIEQKVRKSFLRREYEKALESRPTAACPERTACDRCGACGGEIREAP